MKGQEIANQLKALLPIFTDDFTDQISVSSLTRSGSIITAVTATPHGLVTNDNCTIAGAKEPITITSIIRVGNVVTVVTTTKHKLPNPTLIKDPFFIEISGAIPTDYNGTFELQATPDYFTFQYKITTLPATPATTPGFLLLSDFFLYNGFKTITLVNATTFTYTVENSNLQSPAQGTILLHKKYRIDSAADFETVLEDYSEGDNRETQVRLYIVVNDRETFKKGTTTVDVDSLQITNSEYRYTTVQTFSLYAFVPASDSRLGGFPSDQARGYLKPILKSIGNFLLSSDFVECKLNPVTYQGDGIELYEKPYYVHRFDFASRGEIRQEDTIDQIRVVPLETLNADIPAIEKEIRISFGS